MGITISLANNWATSEHAEKTGDLRDNLRPSRDMIIHRRLPYMCPVPIVSGALRNIIASCDQSLKRLQSDCVDIFYHHRPDPDTPIEETARALDLLVQ